MKLHRGSKMCRTINVQVVQRSRPGRYPECIAMPITARFLLCCSFINALKQNDVRCVVEQKQAQPSPVPEPRWITRILQLVLTGAVSFTDGLHQCLRQTPPPPHSPGDTQEGIATFSQTNHQNTAPSRRWEWAL